MNGQINFTGYLDNNGKDVLTATNTKDIVPITINYNLSINHDPGEVYHLSVTNSNKPVIEGDNSVSFKVDTGKPNNFECDITSATKKNTSFSGTLNYTT